EIERKDVALRSRGARVFLGARTLFLRSRVLRGGGDVEKLSFGVEADHPGDRRELAANRGGDLHHGGQAIHPGRPPLCRDADGDRGATSGPAGSPANRWFGRRFTG